MKRTTAAILGVALLELSSPDSWAATVRCPPRGDALFTLELPADWRTRATAAANEVHAESANREVDLVAGVSDAGVDGRELDDEVARLTDSSFTKVEFSNLHQRRLVKGRLFAVFRGSGRDRAGGAKTPFEIFTFQVRRKTGILFFRYRGAASKAPNAAHRIVESVVPTL